MALYTAYGLVVDSELDLPELEPCDSNSGADSDPTSGSNPNPGADPNSDSNADPDVRVRIGDVTESPADPEDGRLYRVASGHYVTFETIGTMLVSDGRSVVVEPADDAEPEALRQFVLGRGFRLLLHQRGYVVLHASTAVVDGEAVAFLGESGRGKSTTAAGFYGEGHDVLADDVTPVDPDTAEVLAGFQQVKLDRRAAASVGAGPPSTDGSDFSRRYYRVESEFDGERVPLRRAYLLADGPAVSVEPVPPSGRPFHLMRSSASAYETIDDEALRADLDDCARLGSAVPVKRLERPREFDALPDLVAAVEADLADSPQEGRSA